MNRLNSKQTPDRAGQVKRTSATQQRTTVAQVPPTEAESQWHRNSPRPLVKHKHPYQFRELFPTNQRPLSSGKPLEKNDAVVVPCFSRRLVLSQRKQRQIGRCPPTMLLRSTLD